jgi:DNA-directed RNA polymerase specialized sigma24 family protein
MRIRAWLTFGSPCKQFETHEQLFNGLRQQEQRAIVCLQHKTWPMIQKITAGYGLPSDYAADILNQSALIFLQKIESGTYQFEGHNPATYCIEIAKRLALMATRNQKRTTQPIEHLPDQMDPDAVAWMHQRESAETLGLLLTRLGAPCEQVIRLHHIDGYSDEEVIRLQLTKYSTPDSLKMKRSDCMKKLVQLANVWKTSNDIGAGA